MTAHKHSTKKPRTVSSPPKNDQTLAVCMIVKDEERCLPLILTDIQGLADELIIVDTGSTDRTIDIAKELGAHVVFQPWNGDFSAARNRSIVEATSGWILWLDADDRMEAEEVRRLQALRPTLRPDCVYGLEVVNLIAEGVSPPFMQTRLFPNDRRLRFENRIHESITGAAKRHGFRTVYLPVKVIHTGYATPEQIRMKMERNLISLEDELAHNPNAVSIRFLYAHTLIYFNRIVEAQQHYERITITPGARETQSDVYHGALVALADTHHHMKHYQEAETWARRAAQDQPQSIQGWHQWGRALMHLNQGEEALEKFSRALACKQMVSSVQVNYAALRIACLEAATHILISLQRAKEAEDLLKDALSHEDAPRLHELLGQVRNKQTFVEEELYQKGQALLAEKAYGEAGKIYIRMIESNPQSFQAYNGLGLVSWYLGKYEDAYALFRKAVEIHPGNEDILLNLWDAAQITGRVEDGRAVLRAALSGNPDMRKIKELLDGEGQ